MTRRIVIKKENDEWRDEDAQRIVDFLGLPDSAESLDVVGMGLLDYLAGDTRRLDPPLASVGVLGKRLLLRDELRWLCEDECGDPTHLDRVTDADLADLGCLTVEEATEIVTLLHTLRGYLGLIIHRGTDLRRGPNGEDDKPQLEADVRKIDAAIRTLGG